MKLVDVVKMKVFKSLSILVLLVMGLVLVGCDNGGGVIVDEGTPYTDSTKLTANFQGKSFLDDGIGVVSVNTYVDGDTTIFYDNIKKESFTVRYNGIDTPESTYRVDPWGFDAASFTKSKLSSAKSIVLQADEKLTSRLDSTGKRYLAWVWYQPADGGDYRLLSIEIVENCYSKAKGAGTMYSTIMYQADLNAAKKNLRVYNPSALDPKYDYSSSGLQLTLKQLRSYSASDIAGEKDKGKKVRVQGIISVVMGTGSAYIQQQEDGVWYIGSTNTQIPASSSSSDIPYVGEGGHWFVGENDLGVVAVGGTIGQTAYQYYVAHETGTPLSERDWYNFIAVGEANSGFQTPYIVKDLTWYGMYLYGGYTSVSKLVQGREIYVEGTLGYYNGSMQVTGVSDMTVFVVNANRVDPYVKNVDSTKFNELGALNLGTLIKLENLEVFDGYDTKTNDGYTIKVKTSNGTQIPIRVDTNVSIFKNAQGEFDPSGTIIVKSWEDFKGVTFSSMTAVLGIYNGEYQLLLMGTRYFTIA